MSFLYYTLLNGAEQERYRHYRLHYGKGTSFFKAKINRKKIWLDELEVPITTCCSLCCRNCANLLQYYEVPSHVPSEQIIKNTTHPGDNQRNQRKPPDYNTNLTNPTI